MLRKQGVNVENETAQRKLQQDILPQDLVVETHNFSFKNDQKEEYFRQTQAIFIENIENYLFNILNQYQSQNELSWHGGSIPEEEIWVKIGGDHGQGSLKVTLQTLNVENKPNSKFFTSIIAMANVRDNVKNLQILLNRFIDQINALKVTTWNGRKICVFLCGDYHFLTDVHGISGSSGTHPCLWCLQTNTEIIDPRDSTNPPKPRTDQNMADDFISFSTVGNSNLSKAKHFHNVIRSPMLLLSITHTAVPYLYMLLGVVKKHHQLLEQQCDKINQQIAAEIVQKRKRFSSLKSGVSSFLHYTAYIKDLKKIERLEERKRLQETKLVFLEDSLSVLEFYRRT